MTPNTTNRYAFEDGARFTRVAMPTSTTVFRTDGGVIQTVPAAELDARLETVAAA